MMEKLNLLVTLYSDHYQKNTDDTNRELFNDITWSPFDRIVFTKARSLKELCGDNYIFSMPKNKNSVKEERVCKSWNGVKQCMHLIEERFDDENQCESAWEVRSQQEQSDEQSVNIPIFTVIQNNEGKHYEVNYAFYCIYSVRFANCIQNLRIDGQIYDKEPIRRELFKKLHNEVQGKEMDFRCFRSLGSEDMVIIFLSNSMKEIVNVISHINRLKITLSAKVADEENDKSEDLFSTVCVFSGFNDPNYSEKTDLDLIIHLNLRHNDSNKVFNEFKEGLNAKIIRYPIFLGMGAMKLYIRAGEITYEVFHNTGKLNGASPFYRDNIYSSRTYFCLPNPAEDKNADDNWVINIVDLAGLSTVKFNETSDKNKPNETEDTKKFNPVADFIFGEYERLLSTQRIFQWHETLSNQYAAVKSFVEYYSEKNDTFDECAILNYAQSSLHLINQACSPVSEIPNHNHFYAGSFHDLVKSYYGIIEMLFDLAYSIPHPKGTYQHPITFAICLNSIARIESKIFTRADYKNRIVIFFLPYDSFWDYADNIKLLVHEVFHYVSPFDRRFRASCFVQMIYNLLVVDRIHWITSDKIPVHSLEKDVPNRIAVSQVISEWMEYVVKKYDVIKDCLLKKLENIFPGFFIHSNPEWSLLFLKMVHNKTDRDRNRHNDEGENRSNYSEVADCIISVIDNCVADVIARYHDEAMESLCSGACDDVNWVRKTFRLDYVEKKIRKLDSSLDDMCYRNLKLYEGVLRKAKWYDCAGKEAFCDLWSIRISGLNIPRYLAFLLERMFKAYDFNTIIDGLDATILGVYKIDIRATVIRMILLIHKYLNDEKIADISESDLSKLLMNKSGKNNSHRRDDFSQCFFVLAKNYTKYLTHARYEFEHAYNIAFYGVDDVLKKISSYDKHGCCKFIGEVAATNLCESIQMEQIDRLCNFVGSREPRNPLITETFAASSHYERIGEGKRYKMLVSSFGEFMESVEEISKKVSSNNQKHILWYRGVCSDNFALLPSIFRNGDTSLSIYANQSNVIKRAYFSSLFANDVWNLPIEQRMAYLQHYGIPTNLLDFSINPLTALHFAINPDVIADQQKVKDGLFQPVVYVFDPMIYSRAIRRITEWKPRLDIPDTISSVTFDINCSLSEHKEFFVEDMSYDYLYDHNLKHTQAYEPNDRGDPFPVPIAIQQSNNRIKVQSGTFVAFSLHARPHKTIGEGKFDYLNLLKIQERYFKFLHETGANFEDQFLFPIFPRKSCVADLKNYLDLIDISTKRIYPELDKVFEETNKRGLNDGI